MRKRRRLAGKPINAINVVPMTDILLVLLIFFLFIESVELSGAFTFNGSEGGGQETSVVKTVTVKVASGGDLTITTPDNKDISVKREELGTYLQEVKKYAAEVRLVINADKSAKYRDVISIMDEGKSAGFQDISLVDSRK